MRKIVSSMVFLATLGGCGGPRVEDATGSSLPANTAVPVVAAPKAVELKLGDTAYLVASQNPAPFIGAGFGAPEGGGTWTVSKQAAVNLPLEAGLRGKEISLDIKALAFVRPPRLATQELIFRTGDQEVGRFKFTQPMEARTLRVNLPATATNVEVISLTLEIPFAVTPNSIDAGPDMRPLGFFLNSVHVVDPAASSEEVGADRPPAKPSDDATKLIPAAPNTDTKESQ